MDFQFDTTVDGRTLKLLNIVDEYTRECPAHGELTPREFAQAWTTRHQPALA